MYMNVEIGAEAALFPEKELTSQCTVGDFYPENAYRKPPLTSYFWRTFLHSMRDVYSLRPSKTCISLDFPFKWLWPLKKGEDETTAKTQLKTL